MTIKVTYNVTDVYMSQSVSPVYITVSYSDGGASGGGVWGSITGTLSNQTDLQNALNAKFDDPTGTTLQYIDGTGSLQTFPLTLPVLQEVRNQTGATLAAGTVVYINGATGNKPTVTKAIATGDATSAQTLGMISAAIANNGVGYVVVIGTCGGLDTSAYTEGQQLYLSYTTAGAVTTTKPYAPNHLVYVGIVTRSHPNLGTIEVRVQNGFEMDEIHNVSAQTPSNNDGLFYNTTTSLWESKSITTALGYTPVPTTRNITINGVTYDLSADRTWTIAAGISGSGAAGQVTYWTGASAVSGSNNLFWDNANGRLGIGTNAPASTLQVNGIATYGTASSGWRIIIDTTGSSNPGGYINYTLNDNFTYYSQYAQAGFINYATTSASGWGHRWISQGTNSMALSSNGNLSVGTTSNLGVRLGVVGDTLLRGSGATSATTALTVQNSDSNPIFYVQNNGGTFVQGRGASNVFFVLSSAGSNLFYVQNVGVIGFTAYTWTPESTAAAVSLTASSSRSWNIVGDKSNTTGVGSAFFVTSGFNPTSGTGVYNAQTINPTINQTGGANGITRGLYVNPTLTAAADWRSIEWSNNSGWGLYGAGTANNYLGGNVAIGSTSNTSDWLNIAASTTAKAHIYLAAGVAPTSPANGDIWFDGTDIKMRIGGVTKTFTLV